MGSYLVLQICVVTFALALVTTLINKRLIGFPQAIGIPIVSAILVFLLQWTATLLVGNEFISINISAIENSVRQIHFYDFLINGVICFILTASALKFKASDLKAYWKPISILASLSLVICAGLFGILLFGYQWLIGYEVEILVLLLLGAALGATDPIGIKGVLSSIKAPNHLMVKLEGESLLNDAMCIALFMTILNVIKGIDLTFSAVVYQLLYEIVVAAVIGIAFGKLVLKILNGKHEQESLILTIGFLACGSYLVALYAHASAPIACVVGGLIVGNNWNEILSKNETEDVNHFWHTFEGIVNAFLFTLIGLELFIIDFTKELLFGGIVAFIILHISRFAATYISFSLFPNIKKQSYNGTLTILSWGGVRGGISLALILAVANMPILAQYSDQLIGYTFIVVLLSGVVCGLGLPQIINVFYYNPMAPTTGFSGWYQRIVYKLNFSKVQYDVIEENGRQTIVVHDKSSCKNDISKLENPDNF